MLIPQCGRQSAEADAKSLSAADRAPTWHAPVRSKRTSGRVGGIDDPRWPFKTKRPLIAGLAHDRETGRSSDINGFEFRRRHGDAINHWYGMPQAEPENDPILQHALEFFATDFQRLSRGRYAGAFGDEAVEWLRVVDDLVAPVAHGCSNVVRQHALILARVFTSQAHGD